MASLPVLASTSSILAVDHASGVLGIAVQSRLLAVGALVPWIEAGVGAIAVQSWVDTTYAKEGLQRLAAGQSPDQVLRVLSSADAGAADRQIAIIDRHGRSAVHTGQNCKQWAGAVSGEGFSCQGNMLVSSATVHAMAETFVAAKGDLATRLLVALEAGHCAGGDRRGQSAAALLVFNGGRDAHRGGCIDLRVDDHLQPINELYRLLDLYRLHWQPSQPDDVIAIDGALSYELQIILHRQGYFRGALSGVYDAGTAEALRQFMLDENLVTRFQSGERIDQQVLMYLRNRQQHGRRQLSR